MKQKLLSKIIQQKKYKTLVLLDQKQKGLDFFLAGKIIIGSLLNKMVKTISGFEPKNNKSTHISTKDVIKYINSTPNKEFTGFTGYTIHNYKP